MCKRISSRLADVKRKLLVTLRVFFRQVMGTCFNLETVFGGEQEPCVEDLSRLVDVECKEESCNSVPYFRRGGAGDINIRVDVHTHLTFNLQLKIR